MKAHDTFRLWHQKDPREEFHRKVPLLDCPEFLPVGRATEIQYTSDKWEKDGDFYPYVHDHESRPYVYLPSTKVREDDVIGRGRAPRGLLGVRGGGDVQLALLGTCDALIYEDAWGAAQEKVFPARTLLLSSHDLKAVVILHNSCPIIVRGGKMRVTERGIVK